MNDYNDNLDELFQEKIPGNLFDNSDLDKHLDKLYNFKLDMPEFVSPYIQVKSNGYTCPLCKKIILQ